jgi:hypothetical protein
MAELTPLRKRILKVLEQRNGWTTRDDLKAATGDSKGFSEALGSPTSKKTGVRPDSLEGMRFVIRFDDKKPFLYKITDAGRLAARS